MKLSVVMWNNGKAYFFMDDEYIRADLDTKFADGGYPKKIGPYWTGLWHSNIKAAVAWNNGKAYFFKGDEYACRSRYQKRRPRLPEEDRAVLDGLVGQRDRRGGCMEQWQGILLRGDEYMRVDLDTKNVDPGYPKKIGPYWTGLWDSGIDAAVAWNNGKAYFFKGDEYMRVDLGTKNLDPGYPKPIAGNWVGLFGGTFGDPDVSIGYRQVANIGLLDLGGGHWLSPEPGIWVVYYVGAVTNDSATDFTFEVSRFCANTRDETPGTSLDQYLNAGHQTLEVMAGASLGPHAFFSVHIAGDLSDLTHAVIPLHYCGPSGVKVAAVPVDFAPVYYETILPSGLPSLL